MAVGMQTEAPWVMCKEDYAPDPGINACNGFYCDAFSQNKPYKPTLWTGAWSDRNKKLETTNHIFVIQVQRLSQTDQLGKSSCNSYRIGRLRYHEEDTLQMLIKQQRHNVFHRDGDDDDAFHEDAAENSFLER